MGIDRNAVLSQLVRVEWDYYIDKFPVASTVNNIYDVAQKIFYNATMSSEEIKNDYYCSYICNKSLLRSIPLLIPVFGQLVVYSYDWLRGMKQQNDEGYVLSFLRNSCSYDPPVKSTYAGCPLLNSEEFIFKADNLFGTRVLFYASDELKQTPSFLLKSMQLHTLIPFSALFTYIFQGHGVSDEAIIDNINKNLINQCKSDEELKSTIDFFHRTRPQLEDRDDTSNALLQDKSRKFWKELIKQKTEAIEFAMADIDYLDLNTVKGQYYLLRELKHPEIFTEALADSQYGMMKFAVFFDEHQLLELTESQKVEVQILRRRINKPMTEKKPFLSPKATTIYASMLKRNDFQIPEGVEETTKEELQSYLDLTDVDDVRMNLSSIMKTNIIDDLNTLAAFLRNTQEFDYNPYFDPQNRLNIADEIQKMATELTTNKFLSDNIFQLGDNLNRIRMIKQALIDKLMNLSKLQIDCMLVKLRKEKIKFDPFLLQVFDIMTYLK